MKYVYTFVLLIFLISLASADLGTYQVDNCVELRATLNTTAGVNVSVYYPNSSIALQNQNMTNLYGQVYSHSYCLTSNQGEYYFVYCDVNGENCLEDNFTITGTGNELTLPRTIMTLGLFSLMIFLFVVTLGTIPFIPKGDNKDSDDKLMSVNSLKHLNKVMYAFAWLLMIVIIFFASNISYAYLDGELFGLLFHRIFLIMMGLSLPMAVVWFGWLLVSILQDKKTEKLLYRGFEQY